ncbi:pimeloyl-ACP methyl ester carboxylesterase [Okibacterium sp. HSC-33S16]|uniref:alpha/beta fold hydrolase n=1 Tax=Okibacterium sp. HSC-33S16 TaxID=2910965 RepID=UPI0020A01790|nr:alpha/beta hydrolase [Okibacterium sp. HSC-33S16]MCP2032664.1 pimeloyl-ACP methyl ester carboxylesterase [Okibacterium sp. HSC-33S16]
MTLLSEHTDRVSTRLGSLHVRTIGSGLPTVLWSSMFVDSHTWDRLLPLLQRDRSVPRRVILIDPPGLGLSEPLGRASSITEAAEAAREALDGLDVGGPVDWVGNAFGGHIGYELATDPTVVRSLVAISAPTEPIDNALRRKIAALRPILRLAGPVGPVRTAMITALITDASAADPEIRSVVLDAIRRPPRSSLAWALQSFILNRVDVTDRLPQIAVPSLFVSSDDRGDWTPAGAERAAKQTPDARTTMIPDARTLIPLEQPQLLASAMLDFWEHTER